MKNLNNQTLARFVFITLTSLSSLVGAADSQNNIRNGSAAEILKKLAAENQFQLPVEIMMVEDHRAKKNEIPFNLRAYYAADTIVAGPTTSGGGGNICFTTSGPRLLDMVWNNKLILRTSQYTQPGFQVKETNKKFTAFNPLVGELKQKIESLIAPFVAKYPEDGRVLRTSIENNWFFAVPTIFSSAIGAYYQSPEVCNAGNVRAAIALVGGVKFVSIPIWNSLDLNTQAELIIHEGWRFAQVVLGFPLSNQALQKNNF